MNNFLSLKYSLLAVLLFSITPNHVMASSPMPNKTKAVIAIGAAAALGAGIYLGYRLHRKKKLKAAQTKREISQKEKNENLEEAVLDDELEKITYWLNQGAHINFSSYKSLLAHAARNYSLPTMRLLLAYRALDGEVIDINASGRDGYTALYWAVFDKQFEAVELLLAYRSPNGLVVNVNARDKSGWTPCMVASSVGYLPILRLLLAYRPGTIDVNVSGLDDGYTALTLAIRGGRIEVVELLLANPKLEVNVNVRNKSGVTPCMMASHRGDISMLKLLLPHISANGMEVDMNLRNYDGATALEMAAAQGHLDVIRLLLAMNFMKKSIDYGKDEYLAILQKCLGQLSPEPSVARDLIETAIEAVRNDNNEIFLSTLSAEHLAEYQAILDAQRDNALKQFKKKDPNVFDTITNRSAGACLKMRKLVRHETSNA